MASESEASTSRSPSPEVTPFTTKSQHARMSTLSLATSTIDDLTLALTSFSSPPTPEPAPLACCCGRGDDCDATRSWNRVRAKLERGLTLSAEVGQALLQRHEAYVRKYSALEEQATDTARLLLEARERAEALQQVNDSLSKRLDDMMHDYTEAEKRLGQALMSHDVSDSSNKALLQELDTARSVIERLSAQNARAVGWDIKLAAAVQDAEDLKAELDSERHRTKVAEAKCSAALERCAKLEADIHFAGEELEHLRATRSEFSQDILEDARARLRAMQGAGSLPGGGSMGPTREVTEILETLVADNEVLQKDTAELQNLLAESREDNRVLRDELEEAKATALGIGPAGVSTPTSSTWYQQSSGRVTPSFRSHRPTDSIGPRSPGLGGLRGFRFGSPHVKPAPLDLEPDDSASSHARRQSQVTLDLDPTSTVEGERPRSHRPLMLLTRERGVQTDVVATTGRESVTVTVPTPPAPGTSPRPSIRSDRKSAGAASTPVDAYSETSSILDSGSSHRPTGSLGSANAAAGMLGSLVTQMMALLQRLKEADVPTLSARLKRQQLLGAGGDHVAGAAGALAGIVAGLGIGPAADRERQTRDVLGHLSRTTIDRVVREAGRVDVTLPQDETVSVARREMRSLLTLLREIFVELGRLRADVNEVVLNPAGAAKFAEDVMNAEHVSAADHAPKRSKTMAASSGGAGGGGGGGGGWIAPISKLFGGSGGGGAGGGVADPRADLGAAQRPRTPAPRIVSKVGATVGASHATAHVGFSKSGTRGVSTAWDEVAPSASTSALGVTSAASEGTSASGVLALFAGAPQPRERDRDWVVLPRDIGSGGTLRATKHAKNRLSRNLDALSFDGPGGPDRPEPGDAQVTRTLRGRGLSDSSIRSTFLADAEAASVPPPAGGGGGGVFGAFSKRVQGFAHYYPTTSVSTSVSSSPVFAAAAAARARSPVGMPSLAMPIPASASQRLLRGVAAVADSANSSVRDESAIERQISRGKNF